MSHDLSTPAPETPLDTFSRCHLGIVSQLEDTARLPALVQAAAESRRVAQATLALFHDAVLPHHEEEEAELFPAVLQSCLPEEKAEVRSLVETLTAQHRDVETRWKRLEPSVRAAARGSADTLDAEAVDALVRIYLRHAREEEAVFLPLAERILGRNSNHMAALGLSMHMRHARPVAGYI
jgi:hemerythrin-like domain-containing protein